MTDQAVFVLNNHRTRIPAPTIPTVAVSPDRALMASAAGRRVTALRAWIAMPGKNAWRRRSLAPVRMPCVAARVPARLICSVTQRYGPASSRVGAPTFPATAPSSRNVTSRRPIPCPRNVSAPAANGTTCVKEGRLCRFAGRASPASVSGKSRWNPTLARDALATRPTARHPKAVSC